MTTPGASAVSRGVEEAALDAAARRSRGSSRRPRVWCCACGSSPGCGTRPALDEERPAPRGLERQEVAGAGDRHARLRAQRRQQAIVEVGDLREVASSEYGSSTIRGDGARRLEAGILLHQPLEAARRAAPRRRAASPRGRPRRRRAALRARRRAPPPSPPRPDSFSGRCMSPRAISIAGTTPNAIAVTQRQRDGEQPASARRRRRRSSRGSSHRRRRDQRLHRRDRHGDAERRAHHREQHALGEELPDQAAAAGADRRADRDLALAHGRAREQQARDVGAGDHQQERRRAEQREQRRTEEADDLGRERDRARARSRRWSTGSPRRAASVSARSSLFAGVDASRPASAGTSDSMKCAPRLCCATSHVMPVPDVGVVRILEALRHHADDA